MPSRNIPGSTLNRLITGTKVGRVLFSGHTTLDLITFRAHLVPPLYIPPSFLLPSSPSSPVLTQEPKSCAFDFSAFFSSPGLSILRPSPHSREQLHVEEKLYWSGMTYTAPAGCFAASDTEQVFVDTEPPPSPMPPIPDSSSSFKTPARKALSLRPSLYTRLSEGGIRIGGQEKGSEKSSGRSRRMVSDVEAWREMQEVAFEVGMTARKVRKEVRAEVREAEEVEEAEGEELSEEEVSIELERRQRDLLRELDHLESKYQDLFSLTTI